MTATATPSAKVGARATNGRAAKPSGEHVRPVLELAPWEAETDGVFVGHNSLGSKAATPLKMERRNTKPGVHPYDEVEWALRDIELRNWRDDTVNFRQENVEFPTEDHGWSQNAATIVTTKYFRGVNGSPERENSLKQLIDRVVKTYRKTGEENGYFRSVEDAEIFEHELTWLLLHQYFSFNSPVWFNVGWPGREQQVSACFILHVDDTMDSILDWYRQEGLIFKGGSGAGTNLSRIRSTREVLSAGGQPSGPTSFMRGADASAGTIASGGATRRAAKMVILDVDHPDIEAFIMTKAREEKKIRALRDAGFDMDLSGEDSFSVQYQNANNSVRVTDEFMQAVEARSEYMLRSRTTDQAWPVDAHSLFGKMAQAAWECADPGIQYDDNINDWHTCPNTGRINGSNPCSEYMHLDNSSCNLASFNLMKYRLPDGGFDVEAFEHGVELAITAMDISICFADFPTPAIADTTHKYRQLGLGYANIGALLMSTGRAYDSDEGRSVAAAITSLMQGVAARQSAKLAGAVGPYQGYQRNADPHKRVMRKHLDKHLEIQSLSADDTAILDLGRRAWDEALKTGERFGWRNAQLSVLAPTGTIGLMMDCDTTGIEPDLALVKFKKLVGGASMQIVNQQVPLALRYLGYTDKQEAKITAYVTEHGHVVGAPDLKPEHYDVFDCAMGERSISPMGHVRMMAAVQPFISGAISKTVNMPERATVEEVAEVYLQGWKLKLKALAIYRDRCKVGQPLQDAKGAKKDAAARAEGTDEAKEIEQLNKQLVKLKAELAQHRPVRQRLPRQRASQTVSYGIAGAEGYMSYSEYPDAELSALVGRIVGNGQLGEIFIKMSKQGSTLAGIMDAFSVAVSIALQYGVPLETYVAKFINMTFEPRGMSDDPDIRMPNSIMDYIFRRLALDFLPFQKRAELGIFTQAERVNGVDKEFGEDPYAAAAKYGKPVRTTAAELKLLTVSVTSSSDESPLERLEHEHPAAEPALVPATLPVGETISAVSSADAPLCYTCGTKMRRSGSCHLCETCGSTSGCS